jgi:2Fe-2S iron-sulfur cluster protein
MADVTFTVHGKRVTAPAGTLLIEACKSVGIEVPSFYYYPGLSLQGACRMCMVEIARMAKLHCIRLLIWVQHTCSALTYLLCSPAVIVDHEHRDEPPIPNSQFASEQFPLTP